MDSIANGATIRIGLHEHLEDIYNNFFTDFSSISTSPAYSLKIDKKSILTSRFKFPDILYPEIYENAGSRIAEIMNEKGVKDYVIYHGERVDWSTKKWKSCAYLPNNLAEIFIKSLEDSLD